MIFSSWLLGFQRSLRSRSRVRGMKPSQIDLPKTSSDRKLSTRIEQFESRWLMSGTNTPPVIFNVNTTNDTVDVNPGDGKAEDSGGKISLRAAIQEANASAEGNFEIRLGGQTYTLTRSGAGEDAGLIGDLDVFNSAVRITIVGLGPASTKIDGNTLDRVFDVSSSAELELRGLTVQGGLVTAGVGGGIRSAGFLRTDDVNIVGNMQQGMATNGGGAVALTDGSSQFLRTKFDNNQADGFGGAVFATKGTHSFVSTVFTNNSADARGGAIHVKNNGTFVSVAASKISMNTAEAGGGGISNGVDSVGGIVQIDTTEISQNISVNVSNNPIGGGILNDGGSLSITRSLLAANQSSSNGGGLGIETGTVTVSNTTFSGNLVVNGIGGGLYAANSDVILINNTITNNAASTGSGAATISSSVVVQNTIIAGNVGTSPDVDGTFISQGHNVIGNGDGPSGFTDGTNDDQVGSGVEPLDPRLDVLADNGGFTLTHALFNDSPALDFGVDIPQPGFGIVAQPVTDQRGAPRSLGTAPDVGAYEDATGAPVFFVNTTDDTPDANLGDGIAMDAGGKVSLRAAVMEGNFSGSRTIVLPAGIYTLTRTGTEVNLGETGDLDVGFGTKIWGAGSAATIVDANNTSRAFEVSGTVNFSGLGIRNGNAQTENGGGILNFGILSLVDVVVSDSKADSGGGIATSTPLTAERLSLQRNSATNQGGGLYDDSSSLVRISNGVILQNTAKTEGGGIFANGDMQLLNTSVSGNSSEGDAGGISNLGKLTVMGGLIANNSAGNDAAGIGNDGTLQLVDARIQGNVAVRDAGGIGTTGNVDIVRSIISNNKAGRDAGGLGIVEDQNDVLVNVIASQITDNEATAKGGGIGITGSAQLVVDYSAIDKNKANTGGGIAMLSGSLDLQHSSISQNTATNSGGGVLIAGGSASVNNTTVSQNTAMFSSVGGGFLVDSGTLQLRDSTVVENTAFLGGGVQVHLSGFMEASGTIIADNVQSGGGAGAADIFAVGPTLSRGNNFIGVGAGSFTNGINNDQVGNTSTPLDPQLDPLQNNGGLTRTHRPQPGSPVIDAGNSDFTQPTDQRGATRPNDIFPDIGAFETGFTGYIVNTTDDTVDISLGDGFAADASGKTSLRAAIMEANASAGAQAIVLPAGVYQFTLFGANEDVGATGDLDISDNVTITGYGKGATVIDGHNFDRIFDVKTNTTLVLKGVTIQNGQTSGGGLAGNGGAIRVTNGNLTITESDILNSKAAGDGGAIHASLNSPSQAISIGSTKIEGNSATNGGGIYVSGGKLDLFNKSIVKSNTVTNSGGGIHLFDTESQITDVFVEDNSTDFSGTGGGIFIGGVQSTPLVSTIERTVIKNNTAGSGGGVANTGGDVRIQNSHVDSNSAQDLTGGGILNQKVMTVQASSIRQNSASGSGGGGGGISNTGANAELTVLNSEVSSNFSSGLSGGGIYSTATLTITGSTLAENTAFSGGGLSAVSGLTVITSSTFSSNSASTSGGIVVDSATVSLLNVTVTDNVASSTSGVALTGSGTVTLQNTLVANNGLYADNVDLIGAFTSAGNNLIGNLGAATGFTNGVNGDIVGGTAFRSISAVANTLPVRVTAAAHGFSTGDLVKISGVSGIAINGTYRIEVFNSNSFDLYDPVVDDSPVAAGGTYGGGGTVTRLVDPKLGPLANNTVPAIVGGMLTPSFSDPVVTRTHRLLPGSPAIDAGSASGAPSTDQRGFSVPRDGNNDSTPVADIGAYEVFHTTVSGTLFDDTNGDGTRQMGEPGLVGERVYVDRNNNGKFDPGEPNALTTFDNPSTAGINEEGSYLIDLVEPAPSFVSVVRNTHSRPTTTLLPQLGATNELQNASSVRAIRPVDIDADGDVELVYVDGGTNELVILTPRPLEDAGGAFYDVLGRAFTGNDPSDVQFGNFNADPFLDYAVTNQTDGTVSIFMGSPGGPIAASVISVGNTPSSLVAGDFNSDGKKDLAIANTGDDAVVILFGNGSGGFSAPTPAATYDTSDQPIKIVAADFNLDGTTDLATADSGGNQLSIFIGNSNGTFAPRQSISAPGLPSSLLADDYDRDGDVDLIYGSTMLGKVFLASNIAANKFQVTPLADASTPIALATGDIDSDGDTDLLIGSNDSSGVITIVQNSNGGTDVVVNEPSSEEISAITLVDVNGDGSLEVIYASNDDNAVVVQANQVGSQFLLPQTAAPETGIDFGVQAYGTITGFYFYDANNNGFLDSNESGAGEIALFLDSNGNGRQDPYELVTGTSSDDPSTTAINEAGKYTFEDVPAGDYHVVAFLPSNTVVSSNVPLSFDDQIISEGGDGLDTVVFDVNGDGHQDVVALVSNMANDGLKVLLGDGNGRFFQDAYVIATASGFARAIRSGDFDFDGDLDLAVSDTSTGVRVFRNDSGTFTLATTISGLAGALSLAVGDLNGDNRADIVLGRFSSDDVQVIFANTGFTFDAPQVIGDSGTIRAVQLADLDGDDDLDVVALDSSMDSQVQVIENLGGGSFGSSILLSLPDQARPGRGALALEDIDQDGNIDVAVALSDNTVVLFSNVGDLEFLLPQVVYTGEAHEIAFHDVDTDRLPVPAFERFPDLIVGNELGEVKVVRGNGGLSFTNVVQTLELGGALRGFAFGDFDEDNRTDIVVTRAFLSATEFVLFNRAGTPPVTLAGGDFATAFPVGYVFTSSVDGVVFNDQNGDGIRQMSELTLPGITVYADTNGNGIREAFEPSSVSDSNGEFEITGLLPQQEVLIRQELPPNRVASAPVGYQFYSHGLISGPASSQVPVGETLQLADINFDNSLDAIRLTPVSGGAGPNTVSITYHNAVTGNLSSTSVPLTAKGVSIRAADINQDSYVDLVVALEDGSVDVFIGDGPNGLLAPVNLATGLASTSDLAFVDYDDDNDLDILVTSLGTNTIAAIRNDAGTFTPTTPVLTPSGVTGIDRIVTGDFDTDGKDDFAFTAGADNKVHIALQQGGGGFSVLSITVAGTPKYLVAARMHGAGSSDLVVGSTTTNTLTLLTNDFSGSFFVDGSVTLSASISGLDAEVLTFGSQEQVVASHGSKSFVSVAELNMDGKFAPVKQVATNSAATAVQLRDMNGDFKADIVTSNHLAGTAELYFNATTFITGTLVVFPEEGDLISGLQFGSTSAPGSVAGIVFNDFNGNGAQDIGEPGLANVTVYADLNVDGILNPGEPSFVSDSNGAYLFANVPSGEPVIVRQITPATATQTQPNTPGFAMHEISTSLQEEVIAAGDLNGDGHGDIITSPVGGGSVRVYLKNANGDFDPAVSYTTGSGTEKIVLADLNNDEVLDVITANASSSTITVLLNDGFGVLTPTTSSVPDNPVDLQVGNLDSDQFPDLFVVTSSGASYSVLINNGSGGFGAANTTSIAGGSGPDSVALGEFDATPGLDAVILSPTGFFRLYGNDGSGNFSSGTSFTVPSGGIQVISRDFNGDGKADVAIASTGIPRLTIQLGDGAGGFTELTSAAPAGVNVDYMVADDFNEDGKVDLLTVDTGNDQVQLLTNDGTGKFTLSVTESVGNAPTQVASFALDQDSERDFVVAVPSANNFTVGLNTRHAYEITLTAGQNLTNIMFGNQLPNTAPSISVPGTQMATEDTTLVFSNGNSNAISIFDSDAGNGTLQVTIGVTNGTLTLGTTGGLNFTTGDGTADATMTFTGTLDNINAALQGLQYQPTTNANGTDTLSISVSDLGNSGSGGAMTDSDSVTINVGAVNDGPAINVPATQNVSEDTQVTFSSANSNAITVQDLDAGSNAVQLTVSGTNGVVSLSGVSGLTFTTGNGTDNPTMTFTGTLAAINAALNGLIFRPTANFSGTASLSLLLDDQGQSGSGGAQQASNSVSINYSAVNDAPTVNAPATQMVNEDGTLTFSGANNNPIIISDVDAGSNQIQVTLAVTNGLATLGSTAGLSFSTGNGTANATMTFTGTGSSINAALQGLFYRPNLNFNGPASLTIDVNDQGNSGSGGPQTGSGSVPITVVAVNDAPLVSVPGTQSTSEDSTLTFSTANNNVVSISDVDAGSNAVEVTLTVTNGTAKLFATTGLSFTVGDGSDDTTMTFTGSVTDINAALNGLSYTATSNFNGSASLSVAVNDQGNSGTGGAQNGSGSVTINVNGVNDAPTVMVPGAVGVNEDSVLTFNANNNLSIIITDVDAGGATVQSTITVVNGVATLSTLAGLNFTVGDGIDDTTMTFTGTISDINTALFGLTFTPTANFVGTASLSVSVNDQGNSGTGGQLMGSGSVPITVNAVNDAPTVNVPATQSVSEDGTLTFSTANNNVVTLSDIDAGSSPVEVSVGVLNGTLTLSSTAGITFLFGDGTDDAIITLTGSISDINAALNGLIYRPATNYNGSDTLSLGVFDNGNSGGGGALSGSGQVAINVTAVNDAPLVTVPASQSTNEGNTLTFAAGNNNAISIADIDVGAGNSLQVTLTATNGVLWLTTLAGLTFTVGNGSNNPTMTFTGTLADVNQALEGLEYRPNADYNGPASVTIDVSDLGNTGTGGALTANGSVSITVLGENDAPTVMVPATQTVAEDGTLTFSTASSNPVRIMDIDAGTADMLVSLSVANGVLTLPQTTGLTFQVGDGVADITMTFVGSLADVNNALNGLIYAPDGNFDGTDALTIGVNDQGSTGAGGALVGTGSVDINVTAVNDAPLVLVGRSNQTVAEDNALVFTNTNLNVVSISDPDAGSNVVQATVAVQQGKATLSQTTGLSFSSGDGTADVTMTFTGKISDINAALLGMIFMPDSDFNGSAKVTLTVDDLGNVGSGGAQTDSKFTTINVTAINDAPVINSPQSQSVGEDTPLIFNGQNGNAISFTDVDAGQGIVQTTIHVTNGLFSLSQTTGLSFSIGDGTDDDRMVFTGKLADINAALEGLTYTPTVDFSGSAELGVIIDDQGNSGSGGPLSDSRLIPITVNAINDAPVFDPADPTFAIDEGSDVGSVVGTVDATDIDTPPNNLSFAIISGNTGGAFTIDASGTLTVANASALNFDSNPTFTLTVRVTDNSAVAPTPLTVDTTVTVNLNDISSIRNFVVPQTAFAAANGNVTIKRDGEFLRAVNSDNDQDLVTPMLFSEILALDINGRDDFADTLTLDFTGGNPIRSNGSFFGGELDALDSVILLNGPATAITHEFRDSGVGSISIDGTKLTLTSVEARNDKLTSQNRTIEVGDTGPVVMSEESVGSTLTKLTVGDDVLNVAQTTGSFTINRADSSSADVKLQGAASVFQSALFVNLDIGNDSVTVNSAGFNGSATIGLNLGDGNDRVELAASKAGVSIDAGGGADAVEILDTGFKAAAIQFTGATSGSTTLTFLDSSTGNVGFVGLELLQSDLDGNTPTANDGSKNVAVSIEFPDTANVVNIGGTNEIVVQQTGGTTVQIGFESSQSQGGTGGTGGTGGVGGVGGTGGTGGVGGGSVGGIGGIGVISVTPAVGSLSLLGGDDADTFTLTSLPLNFSGKLLVDGGSGVDSFSANPPPNVPVSFQEISLTAESVNIGGNISSLGPVTVTGDVKLAAALNLASPSTLITGNFDGNGQTLTVGGLFSITGTSKIAAGSQLQGVSNFGGNADVTSSAFTGPTTFSANVDIRGTTTSMLPLLIPGSLRVFGSLDIAGGVQLLPSSTTLVNGTINATGGTLLAPDNNVQITSTLQGTGTISGGAFTALPGTRIVPEGKLTLPSSVLAPGSTLQVGVGQLTNGQLNVVGTLDPTGTKLQLVSTLQGNSNTPITIVANDGTDPVGSDRFPAAHIPSGQGTDQGSSVTLAEGTGDGSASVNTDPTGEFSGGSLDVLGPTGVINPFFESSVFIQRGGSSTRSSLSEIATSISSMNGTTNTSTSTFFIGSLQFMISQTLTPLFNDFGQRSGSLLTQTYSIVNTGSTTETFELLRYLDADLGQVGGIDDGARRILTENGEEFLFVTDNASPNGNTAFVGISAVGGQRPQTNRYEISEYSGLRSKIRSGGTLNDLISQDGNSDGRVDDGAEYDVTAALRNLFSLVAGASDSYTTHTLMGSGQPETSLQTAVGRFENLPEGAAIDLPIFNGQNQQIGTQSYRITYVGGDGNDIELIPASSIRGFVFNDLDSDGVSEQTDTPAAGVIVNLRETETNSLIASTVSDVDGRYAFSGLPAGNYRVEFIAPEGLLFTRFLTGGSTLHDSDANPFTGLTPMLSVGQGITVEAVDAGLVPIEIRVSDALPVPEGATGANSAHEFVVSLNGLASRPVSVDVRAIVGNGNSGLALAGLNSDFLALDGPNGTIRITFQPGQTEQIVRVLVVGDNAGETDEAFQLQLSNASNGSIIRDAGLGVIINDDFAQPTVQVRAGASSVEGNPPQRNTLEFTVELLGGAVNQDVTIVYDTVVPTGGGTTATPDVDYIPITGGTVVIPAGQTSAVVRVGIISDRQFEPNEVVGIVLRSATNAVLGTNATAVGGIVDDDNPVPTVTIRDGQVLELDDPSLPVLEFPIVLNSPAPQDLILTYSTLSLTGLGFATPGDDYTPVITGTLLIPRGQSVGVIRIVVTGDQLIESDETFAIEISSVLGSAVIDDPIAIGTIVNDDVARPEVRLRAGGSEFEGRSGRVRPMSYIIEMNGTSDQDVVVFVSTVNINQPGFATAGNPDSPNADYVPFSNRRVVIPAGSVSAEVRVDVIGDELLEPDEMIVLKIDSVSANADLDPARAQATSKIINDDKARPVVTIGPGSGTEGNAPRTTVANFIVRLDAVPQSAVTATYRTVAVTGAINAATPDVDYQSVTNGTVTFAPGQQEATISIIILGDGAEEPPEDFFVELTGITAGVADLDAFNNIAQGTIFDDESGDVQVSLRSVNSVVEGEAPQRTPAQFVLELSRPSDRDIIVTLETLPPPPPRQGGGGAASGFATPGADFVETNGRTIVIPAGQTSVTFGVSVIGDNLFESDERMVLGIRQVAFDPIIKLGPVAIPSPPANVTINPQGRQADSIIVDDDSPRPTLQISNGFIVEGDDGDGFDMVFQVALSGPLPTGTVTIELETATGSGAGLATQDPLDPNRDFFETRRRLFFDPAVTTQEFRVRIIGDDQFEGAEQFFLRLVSAVNADLPVGTLQAVGTIGNDDAPQPTLSINSVNVLEGDTPGQNNLVFTVSLDADPEAGGSNSKISVDYTTRDITALGGTDYTMQMGTLTFLPGERTKSIVVPVTGNIADELPKELLLELSNSLGAVLDPAAYQGLGRIDNDDSPDVQLRVDSVTKREGNSGSTLFDFTVTRVGRSTSNITVDYATASGTATAGSDFASKAGTLTFAPNGPATQTVTVEVNGDETLESEIESFFLTLNNATGASIDPQFSQGAGNILDDDQRVFRADGDAELLRLAALIQDAINRLGNDPENEELLQLITDLSRQVLQNVGLTSGLVFVTDPVDFLLTDTAGRSTGYTTGAGEVTEAPRSYYSGDGRVELVVIPQAASGLYPLQLSSVGSGEYRSAATLVTDSGTAKTITNAGTLSGEVQLALDFRDTNVNSIFPQQQNVFAALANNVLNRGQLNLNGAVDELTLSNEAAQALAELHANLNDNTLLAEGDTPTSIMLNSLIGSLSGMGQALDGILPESVSSSLRRFSQNLAARQRAEGNTPDNQGEESTETLLRNLGRALLGAPGVLLDILNSIDQPNSDQPQQPENQNNNNNNGNQNGNQNNNSARNNAADTATEKKTTSRAVPAPHSVALRSGGKTTRSEDDDDGPAWRYGRGKTPTPWDTEVSLHRKSWPWSKPQVAKPGKDAPSEDEPQQEQAESQSSSEADAG